MAQIGWCGPAYLVWWAGEGWTQSQEPRWYISFSFGTSGNSVGGNVGIHAGPVVALEGSFFGLA